MTTLLIDSWVLLGSEALQAAFLMSSLRKAVFSQAVRRTERMDVAHPAPAGLSATDFINGVEHILFTPPEVTRACQILDFQQFI